MKGGINPPIHKNTNTVLLLMMGRWANEGREAERITPTNTYSSPFTHTHTKVHNYPQHTDEDYQQEGPAPSAQLLNRMPVV